jgi:hypothetical protein
MERKGGGGGFAMKLPVTIKGSSKVTPQMAERQREIQKEVTDTARNQDTRKKIKKNRFRV